MEQDRKSRDNPHTYGHLTYDKGGKDIQWERTVSSKYGAEKTGQ